jgi:hypothetical protein
VPDRAFPGGGGTWLRCQLHSHTTNSDGDASPDELCRHYAEAGFDVLAVTDHWHVTAPDHPGLTVVPASELSSHAPGPVGEAEALALGVAALPEPRAAFPSIEAMAAWIVREGGVPFLCHPYWSGLDPDDIAAAPSLAGIEVWNGGSELLQGNGLSAVHWDDLLHRGCGLFGIATDDCHTPGQDSGLGWTWVLAADRSPGAVVAALRCGDFYGSTGPRLLGIEIEEGAVVVRCSPARSVRLRSGPWDGCSVNAGRAGYRGRAVELAGDGLVTAARFELPEFWRWGRVEVDDREGGRAWSNAFPLPGGAPGTPVVD